MSRKGIKDFSPAAAQTWGLETISEIITFPALGYRTGVFQAELGEGDLVILQGRVNNDFQWLDILSYEDASGITEVVLAPQMRVLVTSSSGTFIRASIGG